MRLLLLLIAFVLASLAQNQTEQTSTVPAEQAPEATPAVEVPTPTVAPVEPEPSPTPAIELEPTPTPAIEPEPTPTPAVEPEPTPTPAVEPEPTPTPAFVPVEPAAEPVPEPALYLDVPQERLESCFRTFRHCVKRVLATSYGYERGSRNNVWQFIKHRTTGCDSQLAALRRMDSGSDFQVDSELGLATLQCIAQIPKAN